MYVNDGPEYSNWCVLCTLICNYTKCKLGEEEEDEGDGR